MADERLFDVPDPRPVHLVAHSGDRTTICGLKDRDGPATPYLLTRFAPLYNRPMARCPTCWATA